MPEPRGLPQHRDSLYQVGLRPEAQDLEVDLLAGGGVPEREVRPLNLEESRGVACGRALGVKLTPITEQCGLPSLEGVRKDLRVIEKRPDSRGRDEEALVGTITLWRNLLG